MKIRSLAFLLLFSFCSSVAWGRIFSDSVKVFNAGIGGNSTVNLLARLERDVFSKRPDLVVLMVGTNDMLNEHKTLTMEQYEKNYRELITRIRSKADVVLMTIPPIYAPYLAQRKPQFRGDEKTPLARLDSANTVIRRLAVEQQCLLIDLNRILTACGGADTAQDGLFQNEANAGVADGVHPTANGYKVIAAAVYQSIMTFKPAVRSIVCFGDSITFGWNVKGQGTTEGDTYPAVLKRMMNP